VHFTLGKIFVEKNISVKKDGIHINVFMQKIVSNSNVGVYLQRLGNINAVLHTYLFK
jgi:hypothetical protein